MRGLPNVPEKQVERESLSDTGAATIRHLRSDDGGLVASHLTENLTVIDKGDGRVAAPPILTVLRERLLQAVGAGTGLILHDIHHVGFVIRPTTTLNPHLSIVQWEIHTTLQPIDVAQGHQWRGTTATFPLRGGVLALQTGPREADT